MKRLSKIGIGLAVLGALLAAGHPARAVCANYRGFDAADYYIYTPGVDWQYGSGSTNGYQGSTVSPGLRGSFWHVGNADPVVGLGNDSGTFAALGDVPAGGWVYVYPSYGATLLGSWSTGGANSSIDGCIDLPYSDGRAALCMAVLLEDVDPVEGDRVFALLMAPADATRNYDFVPSVDGSITLAPLPPPNIVNSQRTSGPGVLLDVVGPDAANLEAGLFLNDEGDCAGVGIGGATSLIRGYRICTGASERGAPVPAPDAFVCSDDVTPLGGTAQIITDCASDVDVWITYRLVFEPNTVGTSLEASQPGGVTTRINCGPNLADVPEERTRRRERPARPGRQHRH
jgi:hypothetical protein